MTVFLLRQIERERPAVLLARAHIEHACAQFLRELASKVAHAQRHGAEKVAKMGRDDDEDAARTAYDAAWSDLKDDVRPQLETVAKDGAAQAAMQVEADLQAALQQANAEAVKWADERAATLVKDISETTRDRVRETVRAGLAAGKTNDEIAAELEESPWFGGSRALTIARTETAFADVAGNLMGWKASGVVAGKEWKTSEDPCPDCADLDGEVVDLEEEFPDGDPPLHPRCECVLLPVLAEEDEA